MDIIKKIQGQPLYIKKIILWSVVVAISLIFLFLWLNSLQQRMQRIGGGAPLFGSSAPSELKLQDINTGIPAVDQETLKKELEELSKTLEESQAVQPETSTQEEPAR